MLICFVYSDRSLPRFDPTSECLLGRNGCLEIVRREKEGPFYPHVAEALTDKDYRFFAGRIAGLPPTPELPPGHPVSSRAAEDWGTADDEPPGSWMAVKFDRLNDVISFAADMFLVQRWYYTQVANRCLVANSVLFLQRVLRGALAIDDQCIPYLLQMGYLPPANTPLRDVFILRAGNVLTIENGPPRVTSRSLLPVRTHRPALLKNAPAAILDVMRQAVRIELSGLDSIIIPISGGLDSRFILGCALDVMAPEQIMTFSFGPKNSQDVRIGRDVSRTLGLRHLALPYDDRPIGQLLAENFANGEGMYWAVPDFPLAPMRDVVPPRGFVLSGLVGFRRELWDEKMANRFPNDPARAVFEVIRSEAHVVSDVHVRPLLADPNLDPLSFAESLPLLPGADLREDFEYWEYEYYLINRNHFSLQLFRDRAFYLAPYLHTPVMRVAYAIPAGADLAEQAFFEALRIGYPELSAIPTKRHYGFPLGTPPWQMSLTRARQRLMSTLDDLIWRSTGRFFYIDPRLNYSHPRELFRPRHRDDVVRALDDLARHAAFQAAALRRLRQQYLRRHPINPCLLRGLLTVHQWLQHFRESS